jgi:hypothetical protein
VTQIHGSNPALSRQPRVVHETARRQFRRLLAAENRADDVRRRWLGRHGSGREWPAHCSKACSDAKIDYRRYAHPCKRIIQIPVISHDGPEEGPAAAQVASVAGTVCLSRPAPYCFGEVRVAALALLIFIALSR